MVPISISYEKCRQCYRCVRVCPTNALKIDHGKVKLIENRCVGCGTCYKICPHDAVIAHTGVEQVLDLLERGEKVVACLDPTFPAVLDKGTPGQLVTALKKLGFMEVWESAFGGDLIIQAYTEFLNRNKEKSFLSSFCPSVVFYIEKFVPQLVDKLVPVVSPMVATGMAVKKLRGKDVKVVFIGSCISRIQEQSRFKEAVDYVLIYDDIPNILEARGFDREKQIPSDFDGPCPNLGGILSIAGGLAETIGFDQDLLNLDFVVGAGSDRAIRAIQQLQDGTVRSKFLDLLFCEGCIDGPIVDRNIAGPSRKQIVVDYVKSQLGKNVTDEKKIEKFGDLNFGKSFSAQPVILPNPSEEEIQAVLKELNKTYPDHNLDCGACGYNTCRENAIAIVHGLAEMEMCPHYILERYQTLYSRLDKSHKELMASHEKLEQAQRQLIQTEKMASLGQLAAGVAHELNNPLGTITMFARLLQKELASNEKWGKDIDLIVQEADRAAKIVKDLLNFSRQTKIKPGLVNINTVIEEALSLVVKQSLFHNIEVRKELYPSVSTTFADPDMLKQVILNIVLNGAQAMDGRGILTIKTLMVNENKKIQIQISDTGKGIPKEYFNRLFDPFFTTKEKGTGLGLALAYSIVSKHRGSIDLESEVGKGTTFFITLPVLDQKEWMKIEASSGGMEEVQGGKESEIKRKDLIG